MEGVGARFGRSSTRYGPTTVFTGPVRKWKKKWVNVPPPNSNHHHHTAANGIVNGSDGSSHLLFYKWTPIAPSLAKENSDNDNNVSDNGNADPKNPDKDAGVAAEEPPKRKFKYIPVFYRNLTWFALWLIWIMIWCLMYWPVCRFMGIRVLNG